MHCAMCLKFKMTSLFMIKSAVGAQGIHLMLDQKIHVITNFEFKLNILNYILYNLFFFNK